MKTFLFMLMFATSAFAQTPLLTVKDRLRLYLWTQGLSGTVPVKTKSNRLPVIHPEELDRPMRKYF